MTDQPGYTRIPNALLEILPTLHEAELRVLLVIIRKTAGWQKQCDVISKSQIRKATGGMSNQGVIDGIASLIERGLITREPAKNNGWCYQVVSSVDHLNKLSTEETSLPSRPLVVSSVDSLGPQVVYPVDTQKKDSKERIKKEAQRAVRAPRPGKKPKIEKDHDPTMEHPAIITYRDKFKHTPSADDRKAIILAVTDTDLWADVCKLWKANRWDYLKIENLISRYQKTGNGSNGHGKPIRHSTANTSERRPQVEVDLDRGFS